MKKKFALLLVSVMAVGLVACGQAKEGKTEAANNPAIQTTEVSENTEVSEGAIIVRKQSSDTLRFLFGSLAG